MTLSLKNSFVVGSGVIDHMCNSSYGLSNFRVTSEGFHCLVTVANGTQVLVKGQGTILYFLLLVMCYLYQLFLQICYLLVDLPKNWTAMLFFLSKGSVSGQIYRKNNW